MVTRTSGWEDAMYRYGPHIGLGTIIIIAIIVWLLFFHH